MEMVNVTLTTPVSDECKKQITDVGPRIKLADASDLLRLEHRGDPAARERLDTLLADTEVIYGFRLPRNVMARAPRLKWIQAMSAGVNHFLDADMQAGAVILTNTSGIHAAPISEFVIGLMLMFAKQATACFQAKQEKQWRRLTPVLLRDKTVGIVGLGSIGREVARLAGAFHMRVLATRRSAKKQGRARYVDTVFPPSQLHRLLAGSDFVVVALPLTQETAKFIGEAELRAMKPGAYLINIARGDIVDEAALVRALEEHWIAGAGLDVFVTEPLPAESRLWELPNVILTPHISGGMEDYDQQAAGLFAENLGRYLSGRKLLNVVDKGKGY